MIIVFIFSGGFLLHSMLPLCSCLRRHLNFTHLQLVHLLFVCFHYEGVSQISTMSYGCTPGQKTAPMNMINFYITTLLTCRKMVQCFLGCIAPMQVINCRSFLICFLKFSLQLYFSVLLPISVMLH